MSDMTAADGIGEGRKYAGPWNGVEGSLYECDLQLAFPVEKVLKVLKSKGKVENLVKLMGYR